MFHGICRGPIGLRALRPSRLPFSIRTIRTNMSATARRRFPATSRPAPAHDEIEGTREELHHREDDRRGKAFSFRAGSGTVVAVGITFVNGYVFYQWQMAKYRAEHGNYANLEYMKDNFLCSRHNYHSDRWWTMITSGFSHMTLSHLLFNSIAMISFFPAVSGSIGVTRCLVAYVAAIYGGSAAHLYHSGEWQDKAVESRLKDKFLSLFNKPESRIPDPPALGASAGVFGVFTMSMLLAPTASVSIFFIPFPAWAAWGLLTGVDAYCAFSETGRQKMTELTGMQVGHEAHLGGSATGLVALMLLMPRFFFRR